MTESSWEHDKLDRKTAGDFLKAFLIGKHDDNNESFILNVNTEWGFGKTFFLKNLALSLKEDNYPIIYIDAWESDFSNEPLVAIVSEINEQLAPYLADSNPAKDIFKKTMGSARKILSPSLPILLSILTKKLTGMGVGELGEIFSENTDDNEQNTEDNVLGNVISTVISKASEQALQSHNNIKDSISDFKNNLSELVSYIDREITSVNLPLFIFIDELDRCRPNYAIEVLENIKHLFGVDSVYFIVATDSMQLSHSVKSIYGSNFNSEQYLKRFFDQEYNIPAPDWEMFSEYLFNTHRLSQEDRLLSFSINGSDPSNNRSNMFSLLANYFGLSLRDQEQCCKALKTIMLVNRNTEIHLAYILFLIMLRHKNRELYLLFSEGDDAAKNDVVNTLVKSDIVKGHQKFKGDITNEDPFGNNAREREFHIYEIVNAYISLLDKTLPDIQTINTNIDYQNEINRAFTRNFSGGYERSAPPRHNLNDYFDLISQAGQIS